MAPAFVQEHRDVALVTVVESSGSTPRHAGTHMLVSAEGALCGSVGGGRVEMQVVALAQRVARGEPATSLKLNLVQDVAMCCGGTMEFYIEPAAALLGVLNAIASAHAARQTVCLQSDLVLGGKVLCEPGPAQVGVARQGDHLYECLRPPERVLLFGCGHLARAIGPLAQQVEFDVVLCDDNETGAVDTSMAWATQVVASFELRDIEKQIGPMGQGDYLLILTRDHAIDQRIVEATLPRAGEFEYLGLIGSLGKVGRFRKRVLAKGIVDEEDWLKLRAPMGVDIGAETPQEIAVSIVAELIAIRQGRRQA